MTSTTIAIIAICVTFILVVIIWRGLESTKFVARAMLDELSARVDLLERHVETLYNRTAQDNEDTESYIMKLENLVRSYRKATDKTGIKIKFDDKKIVSVKDEN